MSTCTSVFLILILNILILSEESLLTTPLSDLVFRSSLTTPKPSRVKRKERHGGGGGVSVKEHNNIQLN